MRLFSQLYPNILAPTTLDANPWAASVEGHFCNSKICPAQGYKLKEESLNRDSPQSLGSSCFPEGSFVIKALTSANLCYSTLLRQAYVGGRLFSVLMPIHSAPSYHATSSYIKTYSVQKVFPEHQLFFEVTDPAFPHSLLYHEVCFSHAIHLAGDKFS